MLFASISVAATRGGGEIHDLDAVARDVQVNPKPSDFVASFDLLSETILELSQQPAEKPKFDANDVASEEPKGWTKKSNGRGDTFWVHLQTGRKVAVFIFNSIKISTS